MFKLIVIVIMLWSKLYLRKITFRISNNKVLTFISEKLFKNLIKNSMDYESQSRYTHHLLKGWWTHSQNHSFHITLSFQCAHLKGSMKILEEFKNFGKSPRSIYITWNTDKSNQKKIHQQWIARPLTEV